MGSEAALSACAAAEETHRESAWMQIVLIGRDSMETVRVTRTNYFDPSGVESKCFTGL